MVTVLRVVGLAISSKYIPVGSNYIVQMVKLSSCEIRLYSHGRKLYSTYIAMNRLHDIQGKFGEKKNKLKEKCWV